MNKFIVPILTLVLITPLTLPTTGDGGDPWIIDGNTVYVDDDQVYASATPHTLNGPGDVVFEFESKQYAGDVDFIWGFDTDIMQPSSIQLWQNVTHSSYTTETTDRWGCITLHNVSTYTALGIENYSNYMVDLGNTNNNYLYNVSYDTNKTGIYAFSTQSSEGDNYTLCGNTDTTTRVYNNKSYYDWKDWDVDYTHITWEYESMTDWYITPHTTITDNKRYKCKVHIRCNDWTAQGSDGKYWFAFKPSNEGLLEANANGHLYALDPWWDNGFNYKKKITIDHDQVVGSNHYDIPIAISMVDTDLRDHVAQDDGEDIAFVNAAEDTQLYHEIECYDDATGNLTAWVNISKLSVSADTEIYMYYGNAACNSQEDKNQTWNNHYRAVYHGIDLQDSSGYGYTLSEVSGSETYNESDFLGGAFGLVSRSQYDCDGFTSTLASDWSAYDKFHVEIYYQADVDDAYQYLCCLERGNEAYARINNDNDLRFYAKISGTNYDTDNQFAGLNAKNTPHVVTWASVKDESYKIRLDNRDATGVTRGKSFVNGPGFDWGVHDDVGSGEYDGLDGTITEMRMSYHEWNDSWLHTQYNNIWNLTDGGFFTLDAEETIPGADPPTNFRACNETRSNLLLKWDKANCDNTYIEANNAASWARGAGIYGTIYNGTGAEYNWTGLNDGTRFYFQAWSFNDTGDEAGFSSSYASCNNMTDVNSLPTLYELPQNNSANIWVQSTASCGDGTGGGTVTWEYKDKWENEWRTNGTGTFVSGETLNHNYTNLNYSTLYHLRTHWEFTSGTCSGNHAYSYNNETTSDGVRDSDGDGYIELDVRCQDTDGDSVFIRILENTSGDWVELENASGTCLTNTWMWATYGAANSTDGDLYTCRHTNATKLDTTYWWRIDVDDGYGVVNHYRYFHTPTNWGPYWNYTLKQVGNHVTPGGVATTSASNLVTFSAYIVDRNNDTVNLSLWTNESGTWTMMTQEYVTNSSTVFGMGITSFQYDMGEDGKKFYSVNATDNITWLNETFAFRFDANYSTGTTGGPGAPDVPDTPPDPSSWWQTENGDIVIGPDGVSFGDITIPWAVTLIVLFVIALVSISERPKTKRMLVRRRR